MMKMLSLCTALSLGVFLAACGGDEDTSDDPCASVTCSDHGTCVADGTAATCSCDEGYHAAETECLEDFGGSCGLTMTGGSACIQFVATAHTETTAGGICTAAGSTQVGDLTLTAELSSDPCSTEGADIGTCTVESMGFVIYFYQEPVAGTAAGLCSQYSGTWEAP